VDHPFISTLLRSGPVGQGILIVLLGFSLGTWTVIFRKIVELRRAERSARESLRRFRERTPDWLDGRLGSPVPAPVGPVLEAGVRELQAQSELARAGGLGPDSLGRVEEALDAETVDQTAELENGQIWLAVAASASPFIGLFGTVWGIMNAFRGMSLEGSAGIAAVAPGVAEALVTTVAGLAVAIPSVMAYNFFNRQISGIVSLMERFSGEFLRAAHHATQRGTAVPPAPASAESGVGHQSPVFARRNA
jgi:biopolymer transport protein TolQ